MQKLAALLYFLYDPVCHQIAGRSFYLKGFSLAVCVRCFSVYLAGFLLMLVLFKYPLIRIWPSGIYYFLLIPAAADFFLEKILLYHQIPLLRFITGFMLGIALFHLLVVSIVSAHRQPAEKGKQACLDPRLSNRSFRMKNQ